MRIIKTNLITRFSVLHTGRLNAQTFERVEHLNPGGNENPKCQWTMDGYLCMGTNHNNGHDFRLANNTRHKWWRS